MSQDATDPPGSRLADWEQAASRLAPRLARWLLASAAAAGVMLFVSPAQGGMPVLVSAGLLLLTPMTFLLGWMAGMSMFAIHCSVWRRTGWNGRLVYILPILFTAVVAPGFLGGWPWWILSPVVAFLGWRKGTQCAWWRAVTVTAWSFRSNDFLGNRLAATNAEALAMAMDAINKEVGVTRSEDARARYLASATEVINKETAKRRS